MIYQTMLIYFAMGVLMDICYGEWTKALIGNEMLRSVTWALILGFVNIYIFIGLIENTSWLLGGSYIAGLGAGTAFVVWKDKRSKR